MLVFKANFRSFPTFRAPDRSELLFERSRARNFCTRAQRSEI